MNRKPLNTALAVLIGAALFLGAIDSAQAARGSYSRQYRVPPPKRPPKQFSAPKAPKQLAPKPRVPPKPVANAQAKPKSPPTQGKSAAVVTRDTSNPKLTNAPHAKEVTHPSGRRDIYYGKTRNEDGSIGKPHGHTVLNKARQVEYARTPEGKVLKNTGRHIPKNSPNEKATTQ